MSFGAIAGSLEQGLAFAIMALGVYLTFRVLNFPDLTVDGSFPLGGAIAAKCIAEGWDPLAATVMAPILGFVAGVATGLLHAKLKISELLAGILTMTALYSVNLRVMGRANIPLLRRETLLTMIGRAGLPDSLVALLTFLLLVVVLKLLLDMFLRTEFGLALRATGDNEAMIRSLGVDTDTMKVFGVGLSNALVALSGGLVAQYQGFADVGMGIGMVVMGLASVIIGNVVLSPRTIRRATLGVILGSLIYRFAVFVALRAGFAPTDLKLVTSVVVIIALALPAFKARMGMRNGAAKRTAQMGEEGVSAGAGD